MTDHRRIKLVSPFVVGTADPVGARRRGASTEKIATQLAYCNGSVPRKHPGIVLSPAPQGAGKTGESGVVGDMELNAVFETDDFDGLHALEKSTMHAIALLQVNAWLTRAHVPAR
jgi:hypothetical protein